MKFNDFQVPDLFSSTFKALNLGKKIQVLSSTLKYAWKPCQNHYSTVDKIDCKSLKSMNESLSSTVKQTIIVTLKQLRI